MYYTIYYKLVVNKSIWLNKIIFITGNLTVLIYYLLFFTYLFLLFVLPLKINFWITKSHVVLLHTNGYVFDYFLPSVRRENMTTSRFCIVCVMWILLASRNIDRLHSNIMERCGGKQLIFFYVHSQYYSFGERDTFFR